jgi:hypothetical protein
MIRAAGLVAIAACLSGSAGSAAGLTIVSDWNPETDVAATLTISWNRNPEAEVTGYKLSWGTASQQYATTIDAGDAVSYVFTGADPTLRYYFAVQAYDAGGLLSGYSTEVSWAASTAAPLVSITTPVGGTTVSGSIPVTASASAEVGMVGVQFTLDGQALGAEDTIEPYSVSWNTAGAANGSHTLTAIARDAAGNRTTSAPVSVTVDNDTTPPVISAVTWRAITPSGATVTWTTNEASDSQVDFGLTTAYGSTSALNGALVTAHTVSLTGLAGGTTYHVRVRSRDAAGNLSVSGDVMPTTPDGAAPLVSITAPVGGTTVSGSIPVAASASDDVGVVGVQFTLDGEALGAEDTTGPYSASWNTAGAANGSHTLTAVARDAAGNRTTSAPVTVTVNNDTTPPVISAVTWRTVTPSGATVTWTTNEASDSQVDFGLTTAYGSTSALDGALVTAHTVSLTGLTGGTPYHVRVRSRDAAGSLAVSDDVILRRPPRGDGDGDGKADLTVYRPAIGTWFTRRSITDYATAFDVQWGLNGDIPVPGDYDGDGKMDLGVYRPVNGVWYIRQSRTDFASSVEFQWGLNGDIPVPGDYDGDGMADLAVFRPATGEWWIRQSRTGFSTFMTFQWGLSGDVPVPADYDGDGKLDLAVHRPANGVWYIRQSMSDYATSVEFQWGLNGDIAVPGDFDGDGKADLVVWRPESGVWFIRRSTTDYASSVTFQWGLSEDTPVPGDFDGDGKVDLAVFRPSVGTWFLRLSSTNFTISSSFQWGLPGDIPI